MRLVGVVLALVLTLAPLAAGAQQVGKVHRVGLIFTTSPVSAMAGPEPVHPSARAFVQGLRALGYVEGQNLILERRSSAAAISRASKQRDRIRRSRPWRSWRRRSA